MDSVTLNDILSRGEKLSPRVLYLLMHPLVELLMAWRENEEHENERLNEDSIVFSSDFNEIAVTSASDDESVNLQDWGRILSKVLQHISYHDKRLEKIASSCVNGKITSLDELHLQLERRVNHSIYKIIIAVIFIGLLLMAILKYIFEL